MQKYNFYIPSVNMPLNQMATFLYGGEGRGFADDFVSINQTVCSTGRTEIGHTLYLPSTLDNHISEHDAICNMMSAIHESDKQLADHEKHDKAIKHTINAIGYASTTVGVTGVFLSYRLNRISAIMQEYDTWLREHFNRHPDKIKMTEITAKIKQIKFKIHSETDAIIGLGTNGIGSHLNTGTAEYTKVFLDHAKNGILEPQLSINDWSLEGWKNYHLNLNRFGGIAKKAGYVGLALSAGKDIFNTALAYHELGMSKQFGETASANIGNFGGGIGGGALGGIAARKALEKGAEQMLVRGSKTLFRTGSRLCLKISSQFSENFAADPVLGTIEDIGLAEDVVGAGVVAGGAAVFAGADALAAGTAVVLVAGLSYIGGAAFSYGFSKLGRMMFEADDSAYNFFKREYTKWL